jgi:hypothetical protein
MPETASAEASFGELVVVAPLPVGVEEPLPLVAAAGLEAPVVEAEAPDGVGRVVKIWALFIETQLEEAGVRAV